MRRERELSKNLGAHNWIKQGERKESFAGLVAFREKKWVVLVFLMEKKKISTGTWAESQNEIDVIEAQTQMRDYITDMFFPK